MRIFNRKKQVFLFLIFTICIRVLADSTVVIGSIIISGNKVTKKSIILRELTFKAGDTISYLEIENHFSQSKNNLLNTSLFNFVIVDTIANRANRMDISINVTERWYTWPYIVCEFEDRNFSQWLRSGDWTKINYGGGVEKYNMRGLREKAKLFVIHGYNESYSLSYRDLFADKHRRYSIGSDFIYTRQKETAYQTTDNKLLHYKSVSGYAQQSLKANVIFTYRHNLYNNHILELSYIKNSVADSVVLLNSEYLGDSKTDVSYFELNYTFAREQRDSKYYPLRGSYLSAKISKTGLYFLDNSHIDFWYAEGTYNHHLHLKNRLYAASGIKWKKTSTDNLPYFLNEALGYSDRILRGYEYYVIDGQDYVISKNLLKYEILPVKVIDLNFFPFSRSRQFNKIHYAAYFNIFFDAGYVSDLGVNYVNYSNSLANTFLFSYGGGIDFVTYYDRVLRIEYSINKFGENGIYIHFRCPI